MKSPSLRPLLLVAGSLLFGGCDYDLPATPGPTRAVDEHLLGDWSAFDREDHKEIALHVRKLDDFNYVASMESDIYRAFHSDIAKLALLSVQDLNGSSRKYIFYAWHVSDDGQKLILRRVSTTVIPDRITEPAALQEILAKQAANPKLLGEELAFTRKPPPKL